MRVIAIVLGLLLSACSPLGIFNAVVPKDRLHASAMRDISYGAHARQRLDIYPAATPDAPVVIFFYGGAWNSGRKDQYRWVAHALAARGALTIVPDYRLVPDAVFPTFVEDGAQAVAWAQENAARYGGDPRRTYLVGHSAGAHIAALIGLDERYLADTDAPFRLAGVVGLAGPYDFKISEYSESRAAFGRHPHPEQALPVTFAHADAPPFLSLHGEADETVYPRNSSTLAARLQEAGAEATLKTYPKADHARILLALSRPYRNGMPVLADIEQFINARTLNPAEHGRASRAPAPAGD